MDYLVNLSLVSAKPALDARLAAANVTIRRALAPELEIVTGWIRPRFGRHWASEATIAFARQPPSCFLATRAGRLLGFACHEATAKMIFDDAAVCLGQLAVDDRGHKGIDELTVRHSQGGDGSTGRTTDAGRARCAT